jgi:hypothetical protein
LFPFCGYVAKWKQSKNNIRTDTKLDKHPWQP